MVYWLAGNPRFRRQDIKPNMSTDCHKHVTARTVRSFGGRVDKLDDDGAKGVDERVDSWVKDKLWRVCDTSFHIRLIVDQTDRIAEGTRSGKQANREENARVVNHKLVSSSD